MFEETFSDFSFGYRPHRSAEDAVNHDKLMSMVDTRLEDKDIRRLIFEFIKSGTIENGVKIDWDKGTL